MSTALAAADDEAMARRARACTGCHGGNGRGAGKNGSHVPPPPEIGDRNFQANNPKAFFNRVTLAGVDKLTPDPYVGPSGTQHSNLDYLQFINPGDLRVVSAGRGCGQQGCHYDEHAQWVPRSMLATSTGQSIRVPVDQISFRSRSAGGVKVLNVGADEEVVSVARVAEQGDDEA
jgi:hypothetical protein